MEGSEPRTGQSQYPNQNILNQDEYDQGREYTYPRDARDSRDTRDPRDRRDSREYNRDARDPRDPRDPRNPRELTEPTSASAMAAAALISPNTPYYPHYSQSAYSSGHYHQSPSHSHTQAPPPSQSQSQSQNQSQHQGQGHTPPSAPGMISPVESRRTSDDHEMSANRQSLPSIQEVIGKSAPSSFPPSGGLPQPPQSSLPSPFTQNAPPRPFPGDAPSDNQPSPRTLHHPPSGPMYGPRPGPLSSFPEPMRPQQTGRPQPQGPHPSPPLPGIEPHQDRGLPPASAPPPHHLSQPLHPQQPPPPHHSHHPSQHGPPPPHHPSHPQQHPGPPPPHSQPPPHQRPPHEAGPPHHSPYHHGPPLPPQRDGRPEHDDSPPQHHVYPHMSSQHPPYPPPSVPQQQLPPPPGQHVQSPYPGSPRHNGQSALPSPYEQHPNPMQDPSQDFNRSRARYDSTVNRHFEAWSYAEYLARIGSNARTVFNFAEAFGSIAREEHGPQPMPGRMPSDREVVEMISNAEWLKTMLENLRGMVQQTVVSERAPTSANRQKPASYDEMDVPMYNEPIQKPFALNEVKKRRGRAAPPGRCHSCNRIDTPEWRRGPDGARTLCNACGLHYAKLERKKQLENRQIRPKHPDEQRH